MIRRDWPLGTKLPERWILIGQPAHARLSWELAAAWGGPNVPPLVCPPSEPGHSLAGVRGELLDAILHHDDGWEDWLDAPKIDPQHGRPYSFTEMPAADAQRIWTDSIEACRALGPLAGWVVASHFSALQSKHDADYPEWVAWLRHVDAQRSEWLAEWRAASEEHTAELAGRCLAWLQAFDWMSLWLGCRCPSQPGDRPVEPLSVGGKVVGGEATGWPPITFSPGSPGGSETTVRVAPWPFVQPELKLSLSALSFPVANYREAGTESDPGRPATLAWRFVAGDGAST